MSISWAELNKRCRRESDYILTALIINRISLVITWALIPLRIHPNFITFFSIFTGFASGAAFATGNAWAGAILVLVSHILDCTDGNLARATDKFSPLGRLLDWVSDRLVELALFGGAGWLLVQSTGDCEWLLFSMISFGFVQTYYYLVDAAPRAGTAERTTVIGSTRYGTKIKIGLFEPVLYGFVFLGPLNLLNIQIIAAGTTALIGLIYQIISRSRSS